MEDLQKDHKLVMMQHDLVGCQSSESVKKKRRIMWQPNAVIAGDMTACLQVTDIMCAKKVKEISSRYAPRLKAFMKRKAAETGTACKYVVGAREIMMLMQEVNKGLQQWLEETDWIYAGARQGGHLVYLPDLKAAESKEEGAS